jgi:hypothetical protein
MDCVETAHDMTWDQILHRIYVTGSQGVNVFKQQTKDSYLQLIQLPTNGGKTSIYVPELKQFDIAHPKLLSTARACSSTASILKHAAICCSEIHFEV